MPALRAVRVSKPRTPWMVAVPASTTGTKRVRRYFKDREAALAYVVRVKQQGFLGAEGEGDKSVGRVTLGECAALWLARHEQMRMSFFQVRQVLNRLIARHGREPIDAVGHRELDAWLRSLDHKGLSPVTVHNHWRITRRFFAWCRDYLEVIAKNPFAKLHERRIEHRDPAVLTPDQMRACLDAAAGERRLIAYLCLGGFAGLRTTEILRQKWTDIDWVSGEIYVRQPKRVGGWRPRHIEILPALRRHLESLALKEGKVLPGGMRTLYLLRREMMDKLGWEQWPDNCLRHSYRTYHAAHFQDLPKLALQMGHSGLAMTAYIYGTPATKAAAAAWWAL
jgi:integrase